MKHKKFLTLLLSGIMSVCLLCTGCMPGGGTTVDSGDIDSGTGGGGGSGGSGGDVPPVYEANNFSSNIYALVNRQGNEGVFEDYYRRNVSFNELVDRQIGLVATEIIERLNDIYGSDEYKYSFDTDVQNYTTWQVGKARGDKYQVHILGDVVYVFVLDKNGEYILDDNGYPLKDTGKNYRAVYYVSDEDNNMDEYIGNPSCQALASYLLNGGYSDTYLDNQTGYDVNEQKLSVLAGSTYGDNTYVQYDNEIVVEHGQYDKSWLWSTYFADGTAVDRLKYNIAKIIVNNTSVNQMTDTYGSDYDSLLSQIPYLANYLDYYYDEISYFVTNYVVGSDLIMQDNNAISTLQNVLAKSKDYRDTFEYALVNDEYKKILQDTSDGVGVNRISLEQFYNNYNLFYNFNIIEQTEKTFEEEYIFLITILKINADNYVLSMNDYYKSYFDLYYGIDESGYIDEAGTVKSFNQIEFPYTWSDMIACRNVKNYETIISSVIDAVKNQTFASDTHAGQYNSSLIGKSVYATYYRVSRDNNIISMPTMSAGGKNMVFNNHGNYNQFIIPAKGNVSDLSHYDLQISVGDSTQKISLEIKVQTIDDNYNTNIVVLKNTNLQGTATMANNKFVIDKDTTWQATFDLPKTTGIKYGGTQYTYTDGTVFDNNQILSKDSNGVGFRQGDIKDCLIVYVTAYDQFGREIDMNTTYGISLTLTNTYQMN